MKKLALLSTIYAILGTIAAVFYLVFTKQHAFLGTSLLSSLYLFLFALGSIVHILIIVLEKLFSFMQHRLFNLFLWLYNIGIISSAFVMLGKGIITVTGNEKNTFLAAMTGVGHTIISLGGILFFIILNQVITKHEQ